MGSFSGYHPAVIFLYFVLILVFTMFSMHPYFLCAACFAGSSAPFYGGRESDKAEPAHDGAAGDAWHCDQPALYAARQYDPLLPE